MKAERGQATVELALCLPIVAFLIACVVEVGMFVLDRNRTWHAAREAARAAAVTGDGAAIRAAAAASGLGGLDVDVDPSHNFRVRGEPVTVTVTYRPSGHLPLTGRLISGREISAQASMRIEQP